MSGRIPAAKPKTYAEEAQPKSLSRRGGGPIAECREHPPQAPLLPKGLMPPKTKWTGTANRPIA